MIRYLALLGCTCTRTTEPPACYVSCQITQAAAAYCPVLPDTRPVRVLSYTAAKHCCAPRKFLCSSALLRWPRRSCRLPGRPPGQRAALSPPPPSGKPSGMPHHRTRGLSIADQRLDAVLGIAGPVGRSPSLRSASSYEVMAVHTRTEMLPVLDRDKWPRMAL